MAALSNDLGTTSASVIKAVRPLGTPWETSDPFLFCMHHDDQYPAGNQKMGPAASLEGRDMGHDFAGKDGWRMYHGDEVPGFPAHPHRGFETVTVVVDGVVDHFDSLGAAGRYGAGDVQWLTAGCGIQHSEMFPLLDESRVNPLELFQIWLNLPKTNKMVAPHFSMFWKDRVPRHIAHDESGRETVVTLIAGGLGELQPQAPPPSSWANRPEANVAIWTIRMAEGAKWTLPAADAGVNRTLFYYRGSSLRVGSVAVQPRHSIALESNLEVLLHNVGTRGKGPADKQDVAELLLLQGRPIGEPVVAYGPFVMNSPQEIQQAYADYRRTLFGGWPWPSDGPVHPRGQARFARYPDGRVDLAK